MSKRIVALLLIVSLLVSFPVTASACDEEQSDLYVLQILFGDNASFYKNNANIQKLLDALSFNVYLYNVQPGVDIDYANGSSELADQTINSDEIIPFAVDNPSDTNPDLMYEIRKQLELLFEDQKSNENYKSMMSELDSVADAARNVSGNKDWQVYSELKQRQYEYVQVLTQYVPKLLSNEKFFTSALKK